MALDMKDGEEPKAGRRDGDMGVADEAVAGHAIVPESPLRSRSGRPGNRLAEDILCMGRGHGLVDIKALPEAEASSCVTKGVEKVEAAEAAEDGVDPEADDGLGWYEWRCNCAGCSSWLERTKLDMRAEVVDARLV